MGLSLYIYNIKNTHIYIYTSYSARTVGAWRRAAHLDEDAAVGAAQSSWQREE